MSWGFRLPGPFRVSVGKSGVHGGVSVGPVSYSTRLSGGSKKPDPNKPKGKWWGHVITVLVVLFCCCCGVPQVAEWLGVL